MIQDIRLAISFIGHRKRVKLRSLLGPGSTDYLLDLWLRTAIERPDGVLRGMDDLDIAIMAGWTGDPLKFREDLQLAGFLDETPYPGVYALHDWEEHQAWVVAAPDRAARSRHAQNVRWERYRNGAKNDGARQDSNPPVAEKMPEAGPKNGETVLGECGKNTDRIPVGIRKQESGNTPLLSPSSSSTLKGIKTPPVSSSEDTAPKGAESERTGRFVRPSVQDVAAYCLERANGIDPQAFLDHYTANGWRVGKNPMRDWRAAVRQWERNQFRETKPSGKPISVAEKLLAESKGGAAT